MHRYIVTITLLLSAMTLTANAVTIEATVYGDKDAVYELCKSALFDFDKLDDFCKTCRLSPNKSSLAFDLKCGSENAAKHCCDGRFQ